MMVLRPANTILSSSGARVSLSLGHKKKRVWRICPSLKRMQVMFRLKEVADLICR